MNIIIYQGKNGTRVDLKSSDFETMWATVKQISEIFDCTTQNVEYHIKQIFEREELQESITTKEFLVMGITGQKYPTKHYNLDMIIGNKEAETNSITIRDPKTNENKLYSIDELVGFVKGC